MDYSKNRRFTVDTWVAQADGLHTRQQWLNWFRCPAPVNREYEPRIPWMQAGLRRRVSPLGRAALAVLSDCHPGKSCPVVLASRYGDLEAAAALLDQLAREGGVSPMGFSLAVHNAAIGVYSTAREDRAPAMSIAACEDLAEAACIEALGLLEERHPHVLVVCCEEPVPLPYRSEAAQAEFRYAWACRLSAADGEGFSLEVACDGAAAPPDVAGFPAPLRALSFLSSPEQATLRSETGRYLWRRHAGMA